MADILALWPILLFWPAVVLSVLLAGLGVSRRRVPLLVTAAALVVPMSLYLAASPGFGIAGLTPIVAYLLASAAIRRDHWKVGATLVALTAAFFGWLACQVFA